MFLSKVYLTCERSNLAVETINSASFWTLGSLDLSSVVPNYIIHFKGVIISCVTLEVNRLSILFSAETLANLVMSVISLI